MRLLHGKPLEVGVSHAVAGDAAAQRTNLHGIGSVVDDVVVASSLAATATTYLFDRTGFVLGAKWRGPRCTLRSFREGGGLPRPRSGAASPPSP
jgi:hypothetical protein